MSWLRYLMAGRQRLLRSFVASVLNRQPGDSDWAYALRAGLSLVMLCLWVPVLLGWLEAPERASPLSVVIGQNFALVQSGRYRPYVCTQWEFPPTGAAVLQSFAQRLDEIAVRERLDVLSGNELNYSFCILWLQGQILINPNITKHSPLLQRYQLPRHRLCSKAVAAAAGEQALFHPEIELSWQTLEQKRETGTAVGIPALNIQTALLVMSGADICRSRPPSPLQ